MINKIEYEIIKSLLLCPAIDESKFPDEISSLLKDKLIRYNVTGETKSRILYNGFTVTPQGLRAYEEYVAFIETQRRETETLKAAKEANVLSEKANNIAKGSKTISKWALLISIVAAAISLIDIIVSACA